MKIIFVIVLLLLINFLFGCSEKKDSPSQDYIIKKELELKEKELKLKEQEMLSKKESVLMEKEKQIEQKSNFDKIDINGFYWGSIKDGTSWEVNIKNFNGKTFSGYNIVYWKSSPNGYRTSFTGEYDSSSGEIIMYEDRSTKGSGKFIGKIESESKSMSGVWYRYSDNGSFTWNLARSHEEYQ